MIEILFLTAKIVFLLFFVGLGFTYLFIPQKLKSDAFWFAPWFGVILISVLGVIMSQGKIPMELGAKVILALSGLLLLYSLVTKKLRLTFSKEFLAVAVLTLIALGYLLYPMLTRVGFPTTMSLGNLDPLSYNAVGDFLIKNTIFAGGDFEHYKPFLWATGDLIHNSFRWGTPTLLSFFSGILKIRSYEVYSIFLSILFAFSFPLVYILAKRALKLVSSYYLLAIVFLTYAINSTLLYMLYNVFFAQFVFMGIYVLIAILLLEYEVDDKFKKQFFNAYDLLIAIAISSLTTTYPESLVFVLVPILFYSVLLAWFKKDWRQLIIFVKLTALAFIINPVTFGSSVRANLRIIFSSTVPGPIGWENIPYASAWEMLGLYNLNYSRDLPNLIDLVMGLPVLIVWLVGYRRSKNPNLFSALLSMFIPLYIGLRFIYPNFFTYHRAITYSIFMYSALFGMGLTLLIKNKTFRMIVLILVAALSLRSSIRTYQQFYWHARVADKALVSLLDLNKNKKITEPFYTADVYLGEYDLWRRLWREYLLMDKLIVTRQNYSTEIMHLEGIELVLAEKDLLKVGEKELKFTKIVWESPYYQLGLIEPMPVFDDLIPKEQ